MTHFSFCWQQLEIRVITIMKYAAFLSKMYACQKCYLEIDDQVPCQFEVQKPLKDCLFFKLHLHFDKIHVEIFITE